MPPRQRPVAIVDDSRSEASNGPGGKQGPAGKGRRAGITSSANNAALNKDPKASVAAPVAEEIEERPQIAWSTMPLPVLHDYRHAYNLPCPSAFSSQRNSILLSQGIGLRCPTAIAARRARLHSSSKSNTHSQRTAKTGADPTTSRRPSAGATTTTATTTTTHTQSQSSQEHSSTLQLHDVQGQARVSKDTLANSVRKHFNNVAVSEQDTIARFLYKVREERKGRKFRLRFQP